MAVLLWAVQTTSQNPAHTQSTSSILQIVPMCDITLHM